MFNMSSINTVAVFGATGTFGKPILESLVTAGFHVTVFTRSTSDNLPSVPAGVSLISTDYNKESLTKDLCGQDAAVSVLSPAAIQLEVGIVEAAFNAGVRRYIINDFGWGPDFDSLPEFQDIGAVRRLAWDRARQLAEDSSTGGRNDDKRFTWTGITIGNPIDWALRRFPLMGFDVAQHTATIYDNGTEQFTGTTLFGIGQAVTGVLQNLTDTRNRFVKVRSIQTCQNQLLAAFHRAGQATAGAAWTTQQVSLQSLLQDGRKNFLDGRGIWRLQLLVVQLYEPGAARCIVASRAASDNALLGVPEESDDEIVRKALLI